MILSFCLPWIPGESVFWVQGGLNNSSSGPTELSPLSYASGSLILDSASFFKVIFLFLEEQYVFVPGQFSQLISCLQTNNLPSFHAVSAPIQFKLTVPLLIKPSQISYQFSMYIEAIHTILQEASLQILQHVIDLYSWLLLSWMIVSICHTHNLLSKVIKATVMNMSPQHSIWIR